MSHAELRKENNCLNCDAIVDGPYCKNCGQLNAEPKQTFWHLITHFFNDITHFDGKFFATMKTLLLRPGFLSAEYVKGRRMKYLDPVRMYLFISTLFLIAFLSLRDNGERITPRTHPELVRRIDSLQAEAATKRVLGIRTKTVNGNQVSVLALGNRYKHGREYFDSIERSLPPAKRSTGIDLYYEKKLVDIWEVYEQDRYNFFQKVYNNFWHSISKIFFISLPIFAFFLYLLYIRRNDVFYYVSHAIFALHYYCVGFLFWILYQLLCNKYYSVGAEDVLGLIFILGVLVYLYVAMLKFYGQGWFKTLVKFIILSVSTLMVVGVLALILLFNSFFAVAAH